MMFFETPVYTPRGWIEARQLKAGDTVFSWNGHRWVENPILKVRVGQARRAYSMYAIDGMVPKALRCTENHRLVVGKKNNVAAKDLTAGHLVMMSEGTHVFKAQLGMVEMEDSAEPQDTVQIEIGSPMNYLAQGYVCRP